MLHLRRALGATMAAGAYAACVASASPSPDAIGRARVTAKTEVGSTRWLKLQTLDYVDPTGRARKWDMATRTTKRADAGGGVDGVAILALLRSKQAGSTETLLVQQFRPPIDAVTVELPAGLIDKGETAETAALRELKEETGYVGRASSTSPILAMSPGLCDESIRLCVVEVDLDAPENKTPKQMLQDEECISVRRVPLKDLLTTLKDCEKEGKVPFAGLYTLAAGLSIGAGVGL